MDVIHNLIIDKLCFCLKPTKTTIFFFFFAPSLFSFQYWVWVNCKKDLLISAFILSLQGKIIIIKKSIHSGVIPFVIFFFVYFEPNVVFLEICKISKQHWLPGKRSCFCDFSDLFWRFQTSLMCQSQSLTPFAYQSNLW